MVHSKVFTIAIMTRKVTQRRSVLFCFYSVPNWWQSLCIGCCYVSLCCYYSHSWKYDNILSVFSNNGKGLSTAVETIEKETTNSMSLSATLIGNHNDDHYSAVCITYHTYLIDRLEMTFTQFNNNCDLSHKKARELQKWEKMHFSHSSHCSYSALILYLAQLVLWPFFTIIILNANIIFMG